MNNNMASGQSQCLVNNNIASGQSVAGMSRQSTGESAMSDSNPHCGVQMHDC